MSAVRIVTCDWEQGKDAGPPPCTSLASNGSTLKAILSYNLFDMIVRCGVSFSQAALRDAGGRVRCDICFAPPRRRRCLLAPRRRPSPPNPFKPTCGSEDTISYEAGYKGDLAANIFPRLSAVNVCGQAATQFNINGGTVHARDAEAALDGHFNLAGSLLNLGLNAARQQARFVDTVRT